MNVNADQMARGVAMFYEAEIASKTSGIGKFTSYFVLPSIPEIVRKKVAEFSTSPLAEGLVNADGLIDLDMVRDRAQAAMQKCGSVEAMGFRLDANDISSLYDYIRRA